MRYARCKESPGQKPSMGAWSMLLTAAGLVGVLFRPWLTELLVDESMTHALFGGQERHSDDASREHVLGRCR